MTFGGQSVTFVTVTHAGTSGFLGVVAESRVETVVSGCRFRPAAVSEASDAVSVASGRWRATCPPVAAALNASPGGEVKCGGVTYLIDGPPQPKYDIDGVLHHVTVMCKRQVS